MFFLFLEKKIEHRTVPYLFYYLFGRVADTVYILFHFFHNPMKNARCPDKVAQKYRCQNPQ